MSLSSPDEAVVLAGGLGTRLRVAVADRPKAMAQVAGRPFLEWILDQITDWGVRSVILSLGHMADGIIRYFGGRFGDIDMHYAVEREPLGTGGALRNAMEFSISDNLLVLNGDSYCEIDGISLWKHHLDSGAPVTMAVVPVSDCSRYGIVELEDCGDVRGFASRPECAVRPGLINGGIYAFRRDQAISIPTGKRISLEDEIFPRLVGLGLRGWVAKEARFIDIGTPESLSTADAFFRTVPQRRTARGV